MRRSRLLLFKTHSTFCLIDRKTPALKRGQQGIRSEAILKLRSYSIRDNDGFAAKLRSSIMDTALDEGAPVRAQMASQLQWDRKKKRYVAGGGVGADNKKMIRTEGGNLLPATYRSGRYDEWRKSSKSSRHSEASVDITTLDSHVHGRGRLRRAATNGQTLDSTTSYPKMRPANGRSGPASNGRGTELKTSRDVVKSRRGREQASLYLPSDRTADLPRVEKSEKYAH